MQEFFINKDSTLPYLKMELINDGRYDYDSFYQMIQNSTITFSMYDYNTGVAKILNKDATVIAKDGCKDEYYIAYLWTSKDTNRKGKYKALFKIKFDSLMGGGTLIVPIEDELVIYIQ